MLKLKLLLLFRHIPNISIIWGCSLSVVSAAGLMSLHVTVFLSSLVCIGYKSMKPSKHFTQTQRLARQLRGPLAGFWSSTWRYLSWNLKASERASCPYCGQHCQKNKTKVVFVERRKTAEQSSKKMTESKCHVGERAEWGQKKSVYIDVSALFKGRNNTCMMNVCRFMKEGKLTAE